jgi:hypothetical protein
MVIVNTKGERIPVKNKYKRWMSVQAEVLRNGNDKNKIGLISIDRSRAWIFDNNGWAPKDIF